MTRRQNVADALAASFTRLDRVFNPWGFMFAADGVQDSHTGVYAVRHHERGATQISLSCRDQIDNMYYEHVFVAQHRSCQEKETFTISHDGLMSALGHRDDCWLIPAVWSDRPDQIFARDGGDRADA
jgi:hypothetical protein